MKAAPEQKQVLSCDWLPEQKDVKNYPSIYALSSVTIKKTPVSSGKWGYPDNKYPATLPSEACSFAGKVFWLVDHPTLSHLPIRSWWIVVYREISSPLTAAGQWWNCTIFPCKLYTSNRSIRIIWRKKDCQYIFDDTCRGGGRVGFCIWFLGKLWYNI